MPENAITEAVREAQQNKLAHEIACNEWWNQFRFGMSDAEFIASVERAVLCALNHKEIA